MDVAVGALSQSAVNISKLLSNIAGHVVNTDKIQSDLHKVVSLLRNMNYTASSTDLSMKRLLAYPFEHHEEHHDIDHQDNLDLADHNHTNATLGYYTTSNGPFAHFNLTSVGNSTKSIG